MVDDDAAHFHPIGTQDRLYYAKIATDVKNADFLLLL
jgi:hypothetical protein